MKSHPTDPADFPWRRVLRVGLRHACRAAIVLGVALGLYLTLRPSGSFRDLSWLPRFLSAWADDHGRFRNVPAFALLAVPFLILAGGRRARRHVIVALAIFVAATETAQHFIPSRMFEWQDIACGWSGLLATWVIFETSFNVAWRCRQVYRHYFPRPVSGRDREVFDPVLTSPRVKPAERL